jgi:RimJ/RimL family protein N-acetyltransferase
MASRAAERIAILDAMAFVDPVTLSHRGVQLVPLSLEHEAGLAAAAADGELWKLRVTSVPEPDQTRAYIEAALKMRDEGHRFAFAVTDEATGEVLGTTSYHDVLPAVKRVEIGYTWYARRCQRTHVNTSCKLLMLQHAFDTLGCHVVGWRTDNFNFASQAAIERLGAKKDGVIRGHALRRDGTIRDTVMYSLRSGEWPEVKAQLLYLLDKPRG